MSRKETALKYFEMHKEATAARVAEGIEKYRKGDCEISVVSDKPLPKDITVEVAQTSHEFRFGANIFMLDEFETEEKNQVFREKFPEVFNLATLPFQWCSLEPEKGKYRFHKGCEPSYRRPAIDLCLEYCEEKGIEPKAHCLNYDYMRPQWVRGMGIDTLSKQPTEAPFPTSGKALSNGQKQGFQWLETKCLKYRRKRYAER